MPVKLIRFVRMSTWQRLCVRSPEQREMCSAVALAAVMLAEMEEDSDVDMDEVEDMECCLSASALALIYRAPENTTMHMNSRLLDLNRLDARFGSDEFLVENFRFRRNEIGIFMQHCHQIAGRNQS